MSDSLNKLVDNAELVLLRDCFIYGTFQEIRERKIVNKSKKYLYIYYISFSFVFDTLSFVWSLVPRDSNLQIYTLNLMYAFGPNGRYLSAGCGFGYLMVALHSSVMFWHQEQGSLYILTELKGMISKLDNPTPEERKDFSFFLKLILLNRNFSLVSQTIPLIILSIIGGFQTAMILQTHLEFPYNIVYMSCLAAFVLFWCSLVIWAPISFGYIHLVVGQTTTYLRLRLKRIKYDLNNLLYGRSYTFPSNKNIALSVRKTLENLRQISDEINTYNSIVKHLIRDALMGLSGMYSVWFVSAV
jgi:hypothetical protein